MSTSIFLAKLLGPYLLTISAGLLMNQKTYRRIMEDFPRQVSLVYIGGVIGLFFGLLLVLTHNVWTADWRVIITVIGWIGLLKGVWIILFPDSLEKVVAYHLNNPAI